MAVVITQCKSGWVRVALWLSPVDGLLVHDISIVIPTRNGEATLGLQLDALGAAVDRYEAENPGCFVEVVVADNGSSDGTVALVERCQQMPGNRLPRLRVVDASRTIGINAARNVGIHSAFGDLLLVCDADDRVSVEWVTEMVRALEASDVVGGAMDERSLNGDVRSWRPELPTDALPVALDWLPYAVGANLAFRREVFDRLGGFDERYVRGAADVEFSWRAQLAGFRLGYAPGAVVSYRHRDGIRPTMRQAYRYGMADVQLFVAFRAAGLPRAAVASALRQWWALAANVPRILGRPPERGEWCRRLAYRSGRLRGSISRRAAFL